MLFNTFQFAIFLALVVFMHRRLGPQRRGPMLLLASLIFYTLWIPAYLPLLLIDIGINYLLVCAMARSQRPRLMLVLSVGFTLSLLVYFKYAAMIVSSLIPILGHEVRIPEILLPLGISFYSFQIIGFSLDQYRRQAREVPSLARYALFIGFFPQLIAGPILRGSQFLPQLEGGGSPNPVRTRRGLWLLASGIAKKVIAADFLLAPFVDAVFAAPGAGSAGVHLVAIWSFAFQIYFDFSGYTDMGRGIALLLGFELPFNFAEPYLSRNPAEFWRRWHMTLSQWLRDYLYIWLGGNRRGRARTTINLMLTMLLGGLWHGAAWNFVIWGGLHGLLLVLHRKFGRQSGDVDAPLMRSDVLRIVVLFNCVCLIWIFFRAPDLAAAWAFLLGIFAGHDLSAWPVMQCLILGLCVASHGIERYLRPRLLQLQERFANSLPGLALEGIALGALLALAVLVSGSGGEFIYFQF